MLIPRATPERCFSGIRRITAWPSARRQRISALGYQRTGSHAVIRELIYTAGALAPFAVGMATHDLNKRFMTLRSIAVAEAVALLFYEIATHHGNVKNPPKGEAAGRSGPPKLKPQYQAIVNAMDKRKRARHGAVTRATRV
jgi:hypothetical protein